MEIRMSLKWLKAGMLMLSASLVLMGCKKGTPGPAPKLVKSMKKALGVEPNAVVAVNLAAIRNSPPMQDFLKKNRSKMVSFLKNSPVKGCNLEKFIDQLGSMVVLNFDNNNWSYIVLTGTFDAASNLACAEKNAKKKAPSKMMHGKKVYNLENNYVWVASKHSIVALARSPENKLNMGPAKWKAEGKDGLLAKFLTGDSPLSKGKVGSLSNHALSFKVTGLDKFKMGKGVRLPIKLPMPTGLWGKLGVDNTVNLSLNVQMKDEKIAKSVKRSVAPLALVFMPDEFSDSLKFAVKKNVIQLTFKHDTNKLVAFAKNLAAKQMKKMGGFSGSGKVKWKVRPSTPRVAPVKPSKVEVGKKSENQ